MTRIKSLADVIRDAIERDERTRLRTQLAKVSGVADAQLSRFCRKQRDLTLGTADRLCRVLGLSLRPTGRKGR